MVPLLVVAARFGLLDLGVDDSDLEAAAAQLESVASLCGTGSRVRRQPGEALAAELAGSLPMVWGSGQVGPVGGRAGGQPDRRERQAAGDRRCAPRGGHNQVVTFDGPLAAGDADDDLFRDRVEEAAQLRLRLVLVRDDADDP